ncbi:MAG TPA: EAL domain-containing protein [Solirubrobacteraceae bacterium]|jgi:EAL and modified HD-GYP domain-containing signal transduction protein|nr:EAL domain-containing protein [Solirubrobacteraceae bacterium]
MSHVQQIAQEWKVSNGSEVFIGRQPIFDRGHGVVGYEILFRAEDHGDARVLDAEAATATVVLNALTEIGLERIVGPYIAWINLSRESVLSGIGKMLPPAAAGFEILEGQRIDDELIAGVRDLKEQGYRIALDDFEFSPDYVPLLEFVDIVKLDYLALGRERFSAEVESLKPYPVQVLAEKVETKDEHQYCTALGCDLFQGFFYQKPELLRRRRIELTAGSMLQVISALQNSQLQFDELEPLIAHDLPLSLRLLRYINSAFFSLRYEVTSVRQALVMLGMENVRRWATLTVMGSIEGKTPELTSTALIRARFCELAGLASGMDGAGLFTLGMFSLIDAMLDVSLEEVTEELPFPNEMRVALLRHAGPMGRILDAATSLEAGYFGDAKLLVANAGDLYVQSLLWAQEASGALFESIAA